MIRYTAVNPYWNVPADLVGERIAPNVVKLGLPYLKEKGYVVLSSWDDNATPIDPSTVDWKAVAAGTAEVRVRQEPGPANAMGQMKFMFPNKKGVYLHDTPQKELLAGDRGCTAGAACGSRMRRGWPSGFTGDRWTCRRAASPRSMSTSTSRCRSISPI